MPPRKKAKPKKTKTTAAKAKKAKPVSTGEDHADEKKHQLTPEMEAAKWQPGQSGNPAGRPKGSRNKINEMFLRDLQALWEEHGENALLMTLNTKPEVIVKAMVALLPRQIEVASPMEEMTDEQLAAIAEQLLAKYGGHGATIIEASAEGAGETGKPKSPVALPSV